MGKLVTRDGVQYTVPFDQDDDVYIASVKLAMAVEELGRSLVTVGDAVAKIKEKVGVVETVP